jgi:hypothetical protein
MRTDSYKAWAASLPAAVTGDVLWKMKAYRLALFAAEIGWADASRLAQDARTAAASGQLVQALGAVAAHLAAGHAHRAQGDRAAGFAQAAGAARAARTWYLVTRPVLGEDVAGHRMQLLSHVSRLIEAMTPQQRTRTAREESYQILWVYAQSEGLAEQEALDHLLESPPHIDLAPPEAVAHHPGSSA